MKKAILFLLVVATARADSVDTSDKLTIFGRIERMDQAELVLTASFPSSGGVGTKEIRIPRSQIVKIEFDDTTFNPGGNPAIGMRPPDSGKAVTATQSHDTAVMADGERKPCDGATIDGRQTLHCGKQVFPKSQVIRLFLGR